MTATQGCIPAGNLIALVVVTAIRKNERSKKNSDKTAKFSWLRSSLEACNGALRSPSNDLPHLVPSHLEMLVREARDGAAPEAVEAPIAGECLMASVSSTKRRRSSRASYPSSLKMGFRIKIAILLTSSSVISSPVQSSGFVVRGLSCAAIA